MGLNHWVLRRKGPAKPKMKKAGYLWLLGRKPLKFTNKENDQRLHEYPEKSRD
ncbi:MAG: hypothetical protein HOE11_04300 [Candidatus Diapherotrites archaeon]|nr:hypothetical protein [Candidatus Diapherotrites archaeon]MBT4596861.1 hypothetical protein [Candidatus Diapherotrites archaeon]